MIFEIKDVGTKCLKTERLEQKDRVGASTLAGDQVRLLRKHWSLIAESPAFRRGEYVKVGYVLKELFGNKEENSMNIGYGNNRIEIKGKK